jgi:3-oxoacyl-[acyl-carrier protein] reductase
MAAPTREGSKIMSALSGLRLDILVANAGISKTATIETGRDYTLGMQALKRVAQPDDIAGAIAFLASDEARWITGDTIHVDGGSKL